MAENVKAMGGNGIVFTDTTVTEIGTYLFIQQTLAEKLTLNAGLRYPESQCLWRTVDSFSRFCL
jgi:hypothetical protein